VRYPSTTAGASPVVPDSAVLGGLGELAAEIEALARRVKRALSVDALDLDLPA
jgi:hypothetical protein